MSYPVTYHCPACETVVEVEREGYLSDKAVTPYPFEGWRYVEPTAPFENDEADGVRFVCGESDGVVWAPRTGPGVDEDGDDVDSGGREDGGNAAADRHPAADGPSRERTNPAATGDDETGCGKAFYLSFVRYEEGREIDPRPETEMVEINPDPRSRGPRGPSGPGDGFW